MGVFGLWQWVIVLVIVLLLFGGGGKISRMMGDFGRGLRALREGLSGEADASADAPKKKNAPKKKAVEKPEKKSGKEE